MAKRIATAELSSDSVESLREVLAELKDEVRMLYNAIDEFRTDFTHCLRNLPDNLPPPYAHLSGILAAFSNDPHQMPLLQREEMEDENDENLTPQITTEKATVSQQPASVSAVNTPIAAHKSARKKKKSPLFMRIVQQPVLTDVVRSVGYERWESAELQNRLHALREKYAPPAIEEAVAELLVESDGCWQLTPEAREKAVQILGNPK